MTVASCLVVPEGIVLGADSTISRPIDRGYHYLNHNQKIFEFGENSSLALITWGLSALKDVSYRTLIAIAADEMVHNPPQSVKDVAERWASLVWKHYTVQFETELTRLRLLEVTEERSAEEDEEFRHLLGELTVEFCIAGYCLPDRQPNAYWIPVSPAQRSPSVPQRVEEHGFWGQPDLFLRLYDGYDWDARRAILDSPLWTGAEADLDALLTRRALTTPQMNIRDAIDFVHFSIYSTIKAIKFSQRDQVCGGPIELGRIDIQDSQTS